MTFLQCMQTIIQPTLNQRLLKITVQIKFKFHVIPTLLKQVVVINFLKVAIFDSSGTDITNKYLDKFSIDCWRCYLNDEDITNSDLITWLEQPSKNHIKIKFSNDRTYLADKLNIECNIEKLVGKIQLEIIAL